MMVGMHLRDPQHRASSRRDLQRLGGLTAVLVAATLSVATSPPLRLVRGEVAVTGSSAEGAIAAAPFATVLLLNPTGRLRERPGAPDGPPQVVTSMANADGEATWSEVEIEGWGRAAAPGTQPADTALVLAFSPARGVAVERVGLDVPLVRERQWAAIFLDNDHYVLAGRLHLSRLGHAPAPRVEEGALLLPAAPYVRWMVVFPDEGTPTATTLVGTADAQPVQVALPAKLSGEVVIAWGSSTVAPGVSTPLRFKDGRRVAPPDGGLERSTPASAAPAEASDAAAPLNAQPSAASQSD